VLIIFGCRGRKLGTAARRLCDGAQDNPSFIIPTISVNNIQTNLNTFSAFNNRYYTSTTGEQSSNWLYNTARTYDASNSNITVTQFTHTWLQKSVIARIPGTGNSREIVVIGSHQDSINGLSPVNGRAPGADDDGSGSVTILEIFRVLVAANFRPELTVEFHWYSAEEVGLRGSQAIVSDYTRNNVAVRSMLQIDMDGYNRNENRIAIITDYTSSTLNAFVRKLVSAYATIPSIDSRCGYGCSDHASWNSVGIPASFPFEQQFNNINPEIHTADDTTAYISYDHIREFTRVGLGYVIELSFV